MGTAFDGLTIIEPFSASILKKHGQDKKRVSPTTESKC
jgi:hypothetical protein